MRGSCDVNKSGSGMQSIIMSDVMLKTALVIRWWMAAEHWSLSVGTAQYLLKGRHHCRL